MAQHTCPHCQGAFTPPANAAAVKCPHCTRVVELSATPATRWFLARDKKKHGPYTWPQLQALAARGALKPGDLLQREGNKHWVRADTLPELFPGAKAAPRSKSRATLPADKKPVERCTPWLLIGALGGAAALMLAGLCVAGAFLYWPDGAPPQPPVKTDQIAEVKKNTDADTPKKDGVKQDAAIALPKADDAKKPAPDQKPENKKPPDVPRDKATAEFVERLNRHRKLAGLGPVALDVELSRGCELHAKYLVRHVNPVNPDGTSLIAEDPKNEGYTTEGDLAAKACIVATVAPVPALERWMGRLSGRNALLNPDIRSIGVGFAAGDKGRGFCVVDALRGRGEAIIVYPAPKQTDVPLAYSGGAEIADPMVAAGFPITVTFPRGKQTRDARLELSDAGGKLLDGWTWTPDQPPRPGLKLNSSAIIAKGLLLGSSKYHVKATAEIDGKPWEQSWTFTTEDDVDTNGAWAKKALDKVNTYRANAKLAPVTLDALLSKDCLAHARYLVINEGHPSLIGLKAHEEDPKLPGYSKAGDKAGRQSDIAIGDFEPTDGLDSWMATLYHRVPILEPGLKSIGFGCVRGRRQGWATVMNLQAGRDKTVKAQPVFYPAPDQTGVPLNFPNSGEEPNPIPDDADGRAGFPITATFSPTEPLKDATGKLSDAKGNDVPCWFSTPQKLANPLFPKHQGQTVCLIARDPLKPNAAYQVQLRGVLAGKAWEKSWKFTTGDSGLSVADATRSVIDRLNQYRVQAGVAPVALDDKLSFGCQKHAEYLGKNADILQKRKAAVHDEDTTLPWFSVEGLRAAQQSMVFTNASTPIVQIEDLMGTFVSRVHLLDPNLQRVGYGCYHDIGRGWRCVLDSNSGRGDGRTVLYPAPNQVDVPTMGFDVLAESSGAAGFPITVAFPQRASLRNVTAVLLDADSKLVDCKVTTPEKPLKDKSQRNTIGLHPLEPLRAGRTYHVTVSVIVNGIEWRQSWQFTTAK